MFCVYYVPELAVRYMHELVQELQIFAAVLFVIVGYCHSVLQTIVEEIMVLSWTVSCSFIVRDGQIWPYIAHS